MSREFDYLPDTWFQNAIVSTTAWESRLNITTPYNPSNSLQDRKHEILKWFSRLWACVDLNIQEWPALLPLPIITTWEIKRDETTIAWLICLAFTAWVHSRQKKKTVTTKKTKLQKRFHALIDIKLDRWFSHYFIIENWYQQEEDLNCRSRDRWIVMLSIVDRYGTWWK